MSAPAHWLFPLPGSPRGLFTDGAGAPPPGTFWVPFFPHPGAFAAERRHHTHEGVDLYAAEGTPVRAVETGTVVAMEAFTGPSAGSPWWRDTQALLVEGPTGVVVYGELRVADGVAVGQTVAAGALLGHLIPVLRHDKGRPMTMLHLELHEPGTRASVAWDPGAPRPNSLRDPTPWLIGAFDGARGGDGAH